MRRRVLSAALLPATVAVAFAQTMTRKIDPKTMRAEIELDLWALTTITTLEVRGGARIHN